MKITLIRHGQTLWNKEEIFRGRSDIPLDDVGIKQAKAITKRLSFFDIKAVYSSPLKRALETAQIIAKRFNLKVKVDDDLIDFDFGEWQGLSLKEVQKKFPETYQQWLEEPHLANIPNGENLDNVRSRVTKVLDKIIKEQQDDVAVVSHRVINKLLILTALSLNNSYFWQIKQDVGAISILDYKDEKLTLSLLNDTCHLDRAEENKDF
ncbi:MAG: histidine phosphatase family protein [Candidatus Omnitrophica bacterium]|nr:histidine phosphatase family protein [Candidatus Omnitrophota bacterium]